MFSFVKQTIESNLLKVYYSVGGAILFFTFLGIYTEERFFFLIPFLLVGGVATILDYKLIYHLLVISVPLSFSVYLGGNAFVELPTEPLMILFLIIIMFRMFSSKGYDVQFNHHTISLIIIAQLLWLIPVTLNSTDIVLSLKYLLSKYWYVASFYFATGIFIKNLESFRKVFWLLLIPLLGVSILILTKHASHGFSFQYATLVDQPFFDNHVIYGSYLTTILPFVYFAKRWYKKGSFKFRIINYSFYFLIFAVFTTYTRASWLALFVMLGTFLLLHFRLLKMAIISFTVFVTIGLSVLLYQNKYIDFAPNFETTIFHEGDIVGHLESTYTFEDVSGMERVYRWVAAKNMIASKPWLGFGTNCFYDNYKHYAVRAFETYVSDNPEKSTTHNYFIMVLAEQGVVGLLLFILLCGAIYWTAHKLYFSLTNTYQKDLVVAILLSLTAIIFHLLLNDLIETDKIGTLFFFGLAILVRVGQKKFVSNKK